LLAACVLFGRLPGRAEPRPEDLDHDASTWAADGYLDDLTGLTFADPLPALVVAEVVALRRAGRPVRLEVVARAVAEAGHRHAELIDLVEIAGHPAEIARRLEDVRRIQLARLLADLADMNGRPGGPERVAALLGRAAA
jgi:hypothetical protein